MTFNLTSAIQHQQREYPEDLDELSRVCKLQLRSERRAKQLESLEDLRTRMNDAQKQVNESARESGSSNWLTSLPLEDSGHVLTKQEFWDALNLRFNWPLSRTPSKCVCGDNFDLNHAFSCKKGGFVSSRHNELRNISASLLSEVCKDVCVEPALVPLSGETLIPKTANTSAEARLDISARGVWATGQRAFFDVRVFNPFARRYSGLTLSQAYKSNETEKKRSYNDRILQIENATFTPLVFSCTGGMAPECRVFFKQLASLLSDKRKETYSVIASWVKTKLSFALLRSALLCIRGTRHPFHKPIVADTTDIEFETNCININDE